MVCSGELRGENPSETHCQAALQEPAFPSETCQGNRIVLGGEEAEKGESWTGEQTRVKGLVKAHGWLCAALRRAKSLRQTFPKGLGPPCAYGKSVKGFAEIFILTSNVITK